MAWSLKGSYGETCSCERPCGVVTGRPVRFSGMSHPVASDLAMAEAKRSTGLSTSGFARAA
jgi:hypothetical protein